MRELEEGVLEVVDEGMFSLGREKGSAKSTDRLYQCIIIKKGMMNNKMTQKIEFKDRE